MKNRELSKKIVKMADKIEFIDWGLSYKGYELSSILQENENDKVTPVIALMYSKWLDGVKYSLEILKIKKYLCQI